MRGRVAERTHADVPPARRVDDLVPVRVDGEAIRAGGLRPKPAPDTVAAACALLGVAPAQAAGFETTAAGVEACRAAGVRFVVGVDRGPGAGEDELGADVVVADLADLLDPALTA